MAKSDYKKNRHRSIPAEAPSRYSKADVDRPIPRAVGRKPGGPAVGVVHVDPLIPEGTYDAVAGASRIVSFFFGKSLKLSLDLNVIVRDADHPNGQRTVLLHRYYIVKPAPGGRFKVGPKSDYAREFAMIMGRALWRPDRLEAATFRGALLEVVVRTVTMEFRQRPLAEGARYSIVDHIVAVKAGGAPVP